MARRKFAIMAVDPGGTSGWAVGFIPEGNSVRASLAKADVKSGSVKGQPIAQAEAIAELWLNFVFVASVQERVRPRDIHFVWEAFQVRRKAVELSPLEVRTLCEGMLVKHKGVVFEQQSASQAKTYATDKRLRLWDQWVRGSAHERDARRHLALKLNVLMSDGVFPSNSDS
jgi:hypothetical protein